jgi:hypothetical protein
MSPEERIRITRIIPPDLTAEDVVIRHGNAMRGPSDPCWYVSIHGKAVPGFYSPEDAAGLRAQILEVSNVKAEYAEIKAGLHPRSHHCPFCITSSETGDVCPRCVEAYQLDYVDPADDSDLLNYHNRY